MLREARGNVDWNAKNDNGWYPLIMAVEADLADILETILSVPPPHLDLSVGLNDFLTVAQLAVMKNTDSQETTYIQHSHWSSSDNTALSLVQLLQYCALIGPELQSVEIFSLLVLLRQQSYAIKNQLGHPKPPTRCFGTQNTPY